MLNHCVIPFSFRKGKTENCSYQFRAISSFLITLLNTGNRKIQICFYCGLWFGGRVGHQAWQEFCCVWLELLCHEFLGQSGIWTSLDGELCYVPCLLSVRIGNIFPLYTSTSLIKHVQQLTWTSYLGWNPKIVQQNTSYMR